MNTIPAKRMIEWNTALKYVDITKKVATMPKQDKGSTEKLLKEYYEEAQTAIQDQYLEEAKKIMEVFPKKLTEALEKVGINEDKLLEMIVENINKGKNQEAKDWIHKGLLRGVKENTTTATDGITRMKMLFDIVG